MSDNEIKGTAGTAASVLAASGATPFGWVSLGASLLSGQKVDKSGAQAMAEGGYGPFTAENKGGINSALIEFDNSLHVAVAALGVVLVVYAVKKWGR